MARKKPRLSEKIYLICFFAENNAKVYSMLVRGVDTMVEEMTVDEAMFSVVNEHRETIFCIPQSRLVSCLCEDAIVEEEKKVNNIVKLAE